MTLASIAPDLVELLNRSSEKGRRQAVAVACQLAVERSGLRDPRADVLLSRLKQGLVDDPNDRETAEALTEELDIVAWDIQELTESTDIPTERYVEAFSKARAAGSLTFGFDPDSLVAALGALYEAHHAIQDLDTLQTAVKVAVSSDS